MLIRSARGAVLGAIGLSCLAVRLVRAQAGEGGSSSNYVDDTNPWIKFVGSWKEVVNDQLYQYTSMLTRDKGATATFNFIGESFTIFGISDQASFSVKVDGQDAHVPSVSSDSNKTSAIFSQTQLGPDKQHTVILEVTSSGNFSFDAVVIRGSSASSKAALCPPKGHQACTVVNFQSIPKAHQSKPSTDRGGLLSTPLLHAGIKLKLGKLDSDSSTPKGNSGDESGNPSGQSQDEKMGKEDDDKDGGKHQHQNQGKETPKDQPTTDSADKEDDPGTKIGKTSEHHSKEDPAGVDTTKSEKAGLEHHEPKPAKQTESESPKTKDSAPYDLEEPEETSAPHNQTGGADGGAVGGGGSNEHESHREGDHREGNSGGQTHKKPSLIPAIVKLVDFDEDHKPSKSNASESSNPTDAGTLGNSSDPHKPSYSNHPITSGGLSRPLGHGTGEEHHSKSNDSGIEPPEPKTLVDIKGGVVSLPFSRKKLGVPSRKHSDKPEKKTRIAIKGGNLVPDRGLNTTQHAAILEDDLNPKSPPPSKLPVDKHPDDPAADKPSPTPKKVISIKGGPTDTGLPSGIDLPKTVLPGSHSTKLSDGEDVLGKKSVTGSFKDPGGQDDDKVPPIGSVVIKSNSHHDPGSAATNVAVAQAPVPKSSSGDSSASSNKTSGGTDGNPTTMIPDSTKDIDPKDANPKDTNPKDALDHLISTKGAHFGNHSSIVLEEPTNTGKGLEKDRGLEGNSSSGASNTPKDTNSKDALDPLISTKGAHFGNHSSIVLEEPTNTGKGLEKDPGLEGNSSSGASNTPKDANPKDALDPLISTKGAHFGNHSSIVLEEPTNTGKGLEKDRGLEGNSSSGASNTPKDTNSKDALDPLISTKGAHFGNHSSIVLEEPTNTGKGLGKDRGLEGNSSSGASNTPKDANPKDALDPLISTKGAHFGNYSSIVLEEPTNTGKGLEKDRGLEGNSSSGASNTPKDANPKDALDPLISTKGAHFGNHSSIVLEEPTNTGKGLEKDRGLEGNSSSGASNTPKDANPKDALDPLISTKGAHFGNHSSIVLEEPTNTGKGLEKDRGLEGNSSSGASNTPKDANPKDALDPLISTKGAHFGNHSSIVLEEPTNTGKGLEKDRGLEGNSSSGASNTPKDTNSKDALDPLISTKGAHFGNHSSIVLEEPTNTGKGLEKDPGLEGNSSGASNITVGGTTLSRLASKSDKDAPTKGPDSKAPVVGKDLPTAVNKPNTTTNTSLLFGSGEPLFDHQPNAKSPEKTGQQGDKSANSSAVSKSGVNSSNIVSTSGKNSSTVLVGAASHSAGTKKPTPSTEPSPALVNQTSPNTTPSSEGKLGNSGASNPWSGAVQQVKNNVGNGGDGAGGGGDGRGGGGSNVDPKPDTETASTPSGGDNKKGSWLHPTKPPSFSASPKSHSQSSGAGSLEHKFVPPETTTTTSIKHPGAIAGGLCGAMAGAGILFALLRYHSNRLHQKSILDEANRNARSPTPQPSRPSPSTFMAPSDITVQIASTHPYARTPTPPPNRPHPQVLNIKPNVGQPRPLPPTMTAEEMREIDRVIGRVTGHVVQGSNASQATMKSTREIPRPASDFKAPRTPPAPPVDTMPTTFPTDIDVAEEAAQEEAAAALAASHIIRFDETAEVAAPRASLPPVLPHIRPLSPDDVTLDIAFQSIHADTHPDSAIDVPTDASRDDPDDTPRDEVEREARERTVVVEIPIDSPLITRSQDATGWHKRELYPKYEPSRGDPRLWASASKE